jgi:methylated-DNA-protein-cysteine methyltransferase related protein
MDNALDTPIYERIYLLVRQIPPGQVVTYGQIARMVPGCTARMAGYAMAALPYGTDVPWQRVINREGRVSPRAGGSGAARQREILEAEGVYFNKQGQVDLNIFGWSGPDWEWLEANGFYHL